MSRYLTPAKIGLLALIDIYVSGTVPTDATVPVLHFIALHLIDNVRPASGPRPDRRDSSSSTTTATATSASLPSSERWQKAESVAAIVASIHEFEKVLSPFGAAISLPGRRLWDAFLKKLWRIDSLDGLHRFFGEELQRLLALTKEERRVLTEQGRELPPDDAVRLSRNSPFGTFVRRAQLEFSRLSFPKAAELWGAFVKYRQPTAHYWRKRNPGIDGFSFDSVLLAGQHDWGAGTGDIVDVVYGDLKEKAGSQEVPISTDDIESLIEFQVNQMQKYGCRIHPDVRSKFTELVQGEVLVPSLSHYLSFLEAWRSGDYPTSFDYLHRYFDYTMQNRDRLFYQYALLNLAVLQADFGCFEEALSAMLETVTTARENRDNACLNFALNWLFQFGKSHPNLVRDLEKGSMLGFGKETLVFLRVKAKEVGSWTLWSAALLSEAKLALTSGESVATAAEHMARSSRLVVAHNLKMCVGSQLSLQVALWDRLGCSVLSRMMCEVYLSAHARDAVFEDELKITCRLAGILAGRGRYDEAMARLESIDRDALRAWKAGQYWHRYRALIKLRRELHRNEQTASDHLLNQLLQARPDDFEPDLAYIVETLHVENLVRKNELQAALKKINDRISEHRDQGRDVGLRVRLLIVKANLYERSGRPQKGFTLAVRAASAAWRARLLPALWLALSTLANILVALGEFAEAARLLHQVIPRALECDASFMVGTLYSVLGDANMGLAGRLSEEALLVMNSLTPRAHKRTSDIPMGMDDTTAAPALLLSAAVAAAAAQSKDGNTPPTAAQRMLEYLTQATEAFESAYGHFATVEDLEKQCEMRAKQAAVMRAVGDNDRAEDYAAKYLALRRCGVTSPSARA
ncbi:uncharacterized protein PpBr36_09390 [Pyricularia pennisetigena]|uniref:uncharacterized protein n=1 Tax=Pyricularia pennisetigena TaxID=1578925 RepID=UPI00114FF062|nr:uncharacterized protein PpBr36_09390 [Pyricularia pennisetigena]TLS22077.1 hypothetical protein PpBr36_09390 [Pyricularia pennisetigena]